MKVRCRSKTRRLVIQTTSQTNLAAAAFDSSFSTICCQIPGEVLFFRASFETPALLAGENHQSRLIKKTKHLLMVPDKQDARRKK